ncbi:hypothetical protein AAX29_01889 [Aliarcobacter thereius]|uniref:Protein kinase domain-containing protein n=1 Tax=Aliarcobacter thereius TaxID=544718 RepID=A0A1C0B529_9BACT|nr:YrbL family protein [Aliarcobacter thereius]OCL97529.1 hypothetical protein AAX29_01889 [Aliarcobacter thereius]
MKDMIFLEKDIFYGEGGLRRIYDHPNDDSKIIKISCGDNSQNELEYSYFKYLKNEDIAYEYITKFYGKVNTNLGEGLVFEKIFNYDGTKSLTVKEAIHKKIISKEHFEELGKELRIYLFENNILFVDISLYNVLLQEYEKDKYKMVVIDGLGGRYKIDCKFHIRLAFKLLAKRKTKQQWEKAKKMFFNEADIHYDNLLSWDEYSDQPNIIRNREFKKRVRKYHLNDILKMIFTSIFILPISILFMKFFKGKITTNYKELVGLGVNLDKDDGKNSQQKFIEELGVKNLIIRVPLCDIQNIDSYVNFAKSFNIVSKKNILINIMQDRENIENRDILRDNLEEIFTKFDGISDEFQIGTTINRLKWSFFSVKEDYIPFFMEAQNIRDKKFPNIKLLGPSVIDFEYYYNARAMFNMKKIKYDITSALLYVDRRGAPQNTQYGIFDLKNKIDMLFSLVKLSPKTLSDDIYITEVNWPIKNTAPYAPTSEKECVTNEEYTKYMIDYFKIARDSKKIKKVYWHQLIAPGYGLVDNREEKIVKYPQFYALKELLKND